MLLQALAKQLRDLIGAGEKSLEQLVARREARICCKGNRAFVHRVMESSANDGELMRFNSSKVERVDAVHHGKPQDHHCIRDRFASSIPLGTPHQRSNIVW
jgi:hypothetical protein